MRTVSPTSPPSRSHLPALDVGVAAEDAARLRERDGVVREAHVGREPQLLAPGRHLPEHVVAAVARLAQLEVGRAGTRRRARPKRSTQGEDREREAPRASPLRASARLGERARAGRRRRVGLAVSIRTV